jgi:hypothetical protein
MAPGISIKTETRTHIKCTTEKCVVLIPVRHKEKFCSKCRRLFESIKKLTKTVKES